MMLDYLPIFPELMEALEEFDDAAVGRLLRAASVYAFTGTEPDFPAGSPERFAWRFIRQRVDAAALKREKKAAAGGQGGRPKKADESTEKQTKADESREKQTEADESLQEQAQSQEQEQPQDQEDPVSVSPDETDTHNGIRQQYDGRGRAGVVPARWYDPEHPERPVDKAWRTSETARWSIAQRIADHVLGAGTVDDGRITLEDGHVYGTELVPSLAAAMQVGVSPGICQSLANGAVSAWAWEFRLKEAAVERGMIRSGWREELEELRPDYQGLMAYG